MTSAKCTFRSRTQPITLHPHGKTALLLWPNGHAILCGSTGQSHTILTNVAQQLSATLGRGVHVRDVRVVNQLYSGWAPHAIDIADLAQRTQSIYNTELFSGVHFRIGRITCVAFVNGRFFVTGVRPQRDNVAEIERQCSAVLWQSRWKRSTSVFDRAFV